MESIKELRQMLQTNVLGHPILQRVLSIYITRVFLSTRITANQVTILMLVVGFLSAVPLFFGYFWLGLALSYLCILLDASDGEVARYRKQYSLRGIYLDIINHLAIQSLFFLALGVCIAQTQSGWMQWAAVIAGALGALTFPIRRANGDLHRELFVHHYSAHPERFPLPHVEAKTAEFEEAPPQAGFNPLGLIKKAVYYSEYHAIMLVTIAAVRLMELLLWPAMSYPVLSWLIIAYAVISFLYLIKEIVSGYRSIERRIASVAARLGPKSAHE